MLVTSTAVEYIDAASRAKLNERISDFILEKNQEAVREMGIFSVINIKFTSDEPGDYTAMITYSFTPSRRD